MIYNILILLFEHVVKIVFSAGSILLIVNNLSPISFGYYSIAITIFSVLSALASLGLDSILFKKLNELLCPNYLILTFKVRLFAALFVSLASAFIYFLSELEWILLLLFLTISLLVDSFQGFREVAHAKRRYRLLAIASTVAVLVQFVFTFLLLHFEFDYLWLCLPIILNRVVYICVLSIFQFDFLSIEMTEANHNLSKVLQQGFPLMIAAVAGLAYAAQDQWVIGLLLGMEGVAVYAAGIKLVLLIVVIPTIITNVLYRRIIGDGQSNIMTEYLKGLYSVMFYIGVSAFLMIQIFSDYVIGLIYPIEYIDAADVLKVYAVILIVAFFQSLNNKILVFMGLQKFIMNRVLMSLLVNLALNFLMIPSFGILGAAFATVLSEILILVSYYFNSKTRYLFYFQVHAVNPLLILRIKRAF
jgi:O-antigen/teichoic acid export membrane protein